MPSMLERRAKWSTTRPMRHEVRTQRPAFGATSRLCAARPWLIAGFLLLAGCAVGPDFEKPRAPDVTGYSVNPLSAVAATPHVVGGDAQKFIQDADVPGDWWMLFHSRHLNELIEQSLGRNPDLKSAQAALTVAKENVLAQRGAYYPSVNAGFSASRQKQPDTLAPVPSNNAVLYSLFTPQLGISYVPDVFGLNRRTVESLQAQADQARFQMIATYTTLTSNLVVAAIQEAALQAQADATRELVDVNAKMVEILRYQVAKGYASGLDLAAQESQLAQVKAALPPLLKQLDQQHDLIAVLGGRFPADAPAGKFDLASLQLPVDLPLSLPSALVAQRPDVRQAEANMHAASALIGVAEANRLPNIELTANAGNTALAIGQVFNMGTGFWTIGANLTAPIFEGGKLLHQQRAAEAAYTQAAEQYRSTVLVAFQNVADALAALEHDAEGLQAAAAAVDAAKVTLDLSQRQERAGYANTLALLNAEQAYQQARINLVQARANRYADTAGLFQALGGGWWHRPELAQERNEN
jgi:NodT family efflux transporter outer membrane factor (OMF) lipoprotein